ncbi:MAG TPA: succinylglutamate desuccinylase/aspartoacylase family protein [Rectinema sp.]|nr:succinylglutamate desuccinylase/aspartoacylase family protein [Rectinema sp.]
MRKFFLAWFVLLGLFVSQAQTEDGVAFVMSEVKAGKGVEKVLSLSAFLSSLEGTAFDTPVFFLGDSPALHVKNAPEGFLSGKVAEGQESTSKDYTVAVIAGSHANEIAGSLAAYWIIEHCRVSGGKLIVVPRANASAATWSTSKVAAPILHYGARLSNPAHEKGPDPGFFIPFDASESLPSLSGQEVRNLNRQYPGDPTGNYTSQIAYAITRLLVQNHVRTALDLHEASPGSSLAWSIITRPEYLDVAALAVLQIEEETGKSFHLESSRDEFAGYSHWEWGKLGIRAFLVETLNPAQPSDDPTIDQIFNDKAPLAERVFIHLCAIEALVASAYEEIGDSVALNIEGLPSSKEEVQKWLLGIEKN